MLAQLDSIPGVAESRADWAGEHVLIRLSPGASPDAVIPRSILILGKGAARLDPAAEAERIASYRRGEPWMRAGETIQLSLHEARVLGSRFAKESAGPAGLDAAQTKRLEALLTEEIGALFDRMHAAGTRPDDVKSEDLATLEQRLRERIADFATAAQVDTIIETLKSALGMCEREE